MPLKPQAYENNMRVFYIPAIADIAAPTAAEWTAGTELTEPQTADGVTPNNVENTVSTDMLNGIQRMSIGTIGQSFNLRFLRNFDAGGDDVYDLFDTNAKDGFLGLINDGTDPAAGVDCEVYPGQFGLRRRVQSGANSHQAFTVLFTCDDEWSTDSTIAA